MTPEFESRHHAQPEAEGDLPQSNASGKNTEMSVNVNMLKCDHFELLSAYLDGEVTATERRQVEQWLATSPETQCLYRRLLNLRHGCQTLPAPLAEPAIEQTVQQVFKRIDYRRQRVAVWGGTAIAALFVGALSIISPQPPLQIATEPQPVVAPTEPLMVALNTPVIKIPEAPALPQKTAQPAEFRQ